MLSFSTDRLLSCRSSCLLSDTDCLVTLAVLFSMFLTLFCTFFGIKLLSSLSGQSGAVKRNTLTTSTRWVF